MKQVQRLLVKQRGKAVLLKKFCFSIVFFCSFPFSFGEEAQPDARE